MKRRKQQSRRSSRWWWPSGDGLSSWLFLIKGVPLLQTAGDYNRNRGRRRGNLRRRGPSFLP